MSKEMSGTDQKEKQEERIVINHEVGTLPSLIEGGVPTVIEDPYNWYKHVERFAREHVVPPDENPQTPKAFFDAAMNAEVVSSNIKPESPGKIVFLATAKLEAVKQNAQLPNNVKRFANKLEKEIINSIPLLSGPASKVVEAFNAENNKIKLVGDVLEPFFEKVAGQKAGKIVKTVANASEAFIMAASLAGCIPINLPNPTETIILPTPVVETTNEAPVGVATQTTAPSKETQVPTQSETRPSITAENVKNVPPSSKLELDSKGNLIGLPEGTGLTPDEVKMYYDPILKKFPDVSVYFNQDPESKLWILYMKNTDGKLLLSTKPYGNGPEQFYDYPIYYSVTSSGGIEVTGGYTELDVPGGQEGVTWGNGYSQFLGNEITSGSDTYFTDYLNYTSYVLDANPWLNVPQTADLLATAPPATTSLESLTDISKDLTPDQITKLEGILKSSIGLWNKNKEWESSDATWTSQFVSTGDILDLQKDPLIIPLSTTENMQVFVATKGYYLDSNSTLQEIVIPLIAQMPDGKMFSFVGGQYVKKFTDWTLGDNLVAKIEDASKSIPGSGYLNGNIGSVFWISFLPDVQALLNRGGVGYDITKYYNSDPGAYLTQWISKYNASNEAAIKEFTNTGDGLKFIIPFQLGGQPTQFDLSSLNK